MLVRPRAEGHYEDYEDLMTGHMVQILIADWTIIKQAIIIIIIAFLFQPVELHHLYRVIFSNFKLHTCGTRFLIFHNM